MEKIFDIAKDSEQSWGTLATAIDENNNILSDKINELGVFEDIEYQEDILINKTLSPGSYYKIGAEDGILIKSDSYEGAVVLGLSYDKALLLNI